MPVSITLRTTLTKFAAISAGALVLVGCQSKNPMDYLPQATGGYAGANMAMMRESDGLKRLGDEMEKMQPGATGMDSDKAQKVFIAFDTPSGATKPPMYGVATGSPGFAEDVVSKYKEFGATEAKTSGFTTYTSGPVTISPVGTTGIMFYENAAMLDRMINVSKKKEAGARASSEFNMVDSKLVDHAVAVAVKADPLVNMAGPMLGQLSAMNPQGSEALKKVSMLSLAFNWDKQPVVDLQLHLGDKTQADALAAMLNQFIAMAKGMPQLAANPAAQQVVAPLQAKAAEDGVTLTVEVPAEIANKTFDQLDQLKQRQGQVAPTGMPQ